MMLAVLPVAAWTMNPRDFPYRNILILKPGAVGDLLQLTPVLRALKKDSSPKITLIVGTPSTATLFRNDPNVDEVIVFDRSRTPLLPLWNELRRKRFDLVLNFQRSNPRAWLLASAAFPCRVLVYHKARTRPVHAAKNYLETLAPLGVPVTDIGLKLYLDEESRSFARELFRSRGLGSVPVVALNPGATHAVNRWPTKLFAALADRIQSELGAAVIIIGGPDDAELAQDIATRSRSKPVSLAGTTSLLQLGAVLEQCAAAVSGDTGPMHMATAVGTPVIALFGAADPARTGPVGAGHRVIRAEDVVCVPCRSRTCSNRIHLECMEKIDVEVVLRAVEASLRKQR